LQGHPISAAIRIAGDRGGQIGRYDAIRASGETVIIDGLCLSACAMVLVAVSRDQICVTSRANLGLHAAYDLGAKSRAVTNLEATLSYFIRIIRLRFGTGSPHGRLKIRDDCSTRQGSYEHVLPLLSQWPGVVAALMPLGQHAAPEAVHLSGLAVTGRGRRSVQSGFRADLPYLPMVVAIIAR
jgi:hypothetical protein